MTGRLFRVATLAVLAGLLACNDPELTPEQLQRCSQLTGGELHHEGLSVRLDSTVHPGSIDAGGCARCDHGRAAWRAFSGARAALQRVPPRLRPSEVPIHLDPTRSTPSAIEGGIVFHAPARALIVHGNAVARFDASVWLHEMGHLRSAGARPPRDVARKLMRAVEEAVADYYAAIILGSPRLGVDDEAQERTVARQAATRDLRTPPPASVFDWASLSLPQFDADPHKLGWQLSATLWKLESSDTTLLEDLVAALADEAPWPPDAIGPAAVADVLLARCPARSRASLSAALRQWIPKEIWTG